MILRFFVYVWLNTHTLQNRFACIVCNLRCRIAVICSVNIGAYFLSSSSYGTACCYFAILKYIAQLNYNINLIISLYFSLFCTNNLFNNLYGEQESTQSSLLSRTCRPTVHCDVKLPHTLDILYSEIVIRSFLS